MARSGRVLLCSTIFLYGCAQWEPFTVSDKRTSLLGRENRFVEMEIEDEDLSARYLSVRASATDFLTSVTASILGGEDADRITLADASTRSRREQRESGEVVRLAYRFRIEGARSRGSAVALTRDGYFLTANHVIEEGNSRLLFAVFEIDSGATELRLQEFRTVFFDEDADLAVIQADLVTPLHVSLEDVEPRPRQEIYTGGSPFSGAARGRIDRIGAVAGEDPLRQVRAINRYAARRQHPEAEHGYLVIGSTAPVIRGDSGSAAIDEKGRLLGVAVGVVRVSPRRVLSVFAGLPAGRLRKIIEADRNRRASGQPGESVPTMARW